MTVVLPSFRGNARIRRTARLTTTAFTDKRINRAFWRNEEKPEDRDDPSSFFFRNSADEEIASIRARSDYRKAIIPKEAARIVPPVLQHRASSLSRCSSRRMRAAIIRRRSKSSIQARSLVIELRTRGMIDRSCGITRCRDLVDVRRILSLWIF